MDLSIIIPVYNDQKRIGSCLRSVLDQETSHPFEVIAIDDASMDSSYDRIRASQGVIALKNKKNRGQGYSRNRGAGAAKGNYLLFMDSDVSIPPGALEKSLNFMKQNPDDSIQGVLGNFALHDQFSNWSAMVYNVIQHLLTESPGITTSINTSFFLIKKSAFLELGGFNTDLWYMEDDELGRRCSNHGFYFRRGIVYFSHHKHVSFPWLFKQHFMGGRQLGHLNRLVKVKNKARVNSFFRDILLADLFLLFLICVSCFQPGFLFFLFVYLVACRTLVFTFLQVKKNIFFVLYGLFSIHLIPVFVLAGLLTYGLFKTEPAKKNRGQWLSSNKRFK